MCQSKFFRSLSRLSGKGFTPVWKGVNACLEKGPSLSGKGLMPV